MACISDYSTDQRGISICRHGYDFHRCVCLVSKGRIRRSGEVETDEEGLEIPVTFIFRTP